MEDSKSYLFKQIALESEKYFGITDEQYLLRVMESWHEDHSPNARWNEVEYYNDHSGKILDMASGVGTFVLYGLHKGYDIYGVEPEPWKLTYIEKKINEKCYPEWFKDRFVSSFGEKLPYANDTFDFISSYQTLEHVTNVEQCVDEMIRVLKPGGKLRLHAPDYRGWFEPHYMLPFLPKMNRRLAAIYLWLLRKPKAGLSTINWTTAPDIITQLKKYKNVSCVDLTETYEQRDIQRIQQEKGLSEFAAKFVHAFRKMKHMFKSEKHINLVIRKHAPN